MRSSGIPRLSGLGHIRKIIQSRQTPTNAVTVNYTTNEWDETVEQETGYTTQLWLYQGTSRIVQEMLGERTVGTLSGLGTTPNEVDVDDRLIYGGVEYEVVEKTPMPEENPQIVAIGATRRQE
jgi:hypothetical protein